MFVSYIFKEQYS